jgi:hypothetical protein
MTNLKKYEKVNDCETLEQLADVIESFADDDGFIHGRTRYFSTKSMADICREYTLEKHNGLTREFGIRQQAMYILFYRDLK